MTSAITQLKIDISRGLRASLEAAAERAGVSLSEYTRDALLRQLVEDESGNVARPKFGPGAVRRMQENMDAVFGDRVLPGDSTELIREARQAGKPMATKG